MKECLYCGTALFGRVDKKFCNDHCRNTHNNKFNRLNFKYIRSINNILIKNHKILSENLSTEKQSMDLKILEAKGFQVQYFTGMEKQEDQQVLKLYDLKFVIEAQKIRLFL